MNGDERSSDPIAPVVLVVDADPACRVATELALVWRFSGPATASLSSATRQQQ
jgi:hypothetical protein